jgi:DNA modification methylase
VIERNRVIVSDALTGLKLLPDESVNCCVTSPPYYGLRDYGVVGQLGLEKSPEEYVARMVEVFREVKRVLRKDGTVWLNLGDSYSGSRGDRDTACTDERYKRGGHIDYHSVRPTANVNGCKPKDLIGIPWRVAFALQSDGWWLRSDIVWAKPNPMPESVTDRPTRSHEYIFLLTKSARYWYDAAAIAEPMTDSTYRRLSQPSFESQTGGPKDPLAGNRSSRLALGNLHERLVKQEKWGDRFVGYEEWRKTNSFRNARSVWTIATFPFPGPHYATFPPELARRCILAGCPATVCATCGKPWIPVTEATGHIGRREAAHAANGRPTKCDSTGWAPARRRTGQWQSTCDCAADTMAGTVLDPFSGSGTTVYVAHGCGRRGIGLELNAKDCKMAQERNGFL